jgi:hypothetical protein
MPYVTAPIRELGDIIARTPPYARLPTNASTRARFVLFTSNAILQRQVLAPMSLIYKEAKCKSSTIEELLYAHDPEKIKKGMLSDQP